MDIDGYFPAYIQSYLRVPFLGVREVMILNMILYLVA